jgi:drug/metabolite transporter (DMT)-like permease
MDFLGALAAVFAVALLVLPTLRVLQGRLSPDHALGLWIAGAGFLLLSLAALVLSGDAALIAALAGVAAAVAGNVLQRRTTRPPGGGTTSPRR